MNKPSGKSPGPKAAADDAGNLSFEEALAEIESIIDRIEAGDVGLEESLKEYEKGISLVSHCRSKLDRAQQQVDDLTRRLDQADDTDQPQPSAARPS